MCKSQTLCWVCVLVLSFFHKRKLQQVDGTWAMVLMAFSLSFQVAEALIWVYLNLKEARSRDRSARKLSSCVTDVLLPWLALCHGGLTCTVLSTNPTGFSVPLCFPGASFGSLPLNSLLLDQHCYRGGICFPSASTELPISQILVLFHLGIYNISLVVVLWLLPVWDLKRSMIDAPRVDMVQKPIGCFFYNLNI